MPGFVKTPKDEKRWSRAKEAAGKETEKDSESYWKLSNYIYHKMGKTEEDKSQAKLWKSELYKQAFGGMLQLKEKSSIKAPMKTGQISVKTPKFKKMGDGFSKPSMFFKAEEMDVKHPSVQKLRGFLMNKIAKRQSS